MSRLLSFVCLTIAFLPASLQAATIAPLEDVMTSGFFSGTNLVRGYAGDNRNVHRVSTEEPFAVSGAETIYAAFDPSDFSGFPSPIVSAVLTVESASGGFGADAGAGNPFTVSAHGVSADPLVSITDDTNPSGPISWLDFYNSNILAADPSALTVVDAFGAVTFDVTGLVNDWLSGANTVFSIALTGKNDTSGNDFLHGFLNNTENPGSTYLTVQVPEPSSLFVLLASGVILAAWMTRPMRSVHRLHH